MCSTGQSSPQSAGHIFFDGASINTMASCDKAVSIGCTKLFLPSSCLRSSLWGRLFLFAKGDRMSSFYPSGVISNALRGLLFLQIIGKQSTVSL